MSTLMTMKVVTMKMVPPSVVVSVVSVLPHLEFYSYVFGYATDLTQPAVVQLRNASLGATLCSCPLAC